MKLPIFFFLAAAMLAGLLVEAVVRFRRPWAVPALAVYATTLMWYFLDLFVTPDGYTQFTEDVLNVSYRQVSLFLAAFRLLLPFVVGKLVGVGNPRQAVMRGSGLSPERLLGGVAILWLTLLVIGASMMNYDFIGALFPIDARAGSRMWSRDAAEGAGPTGFLVSTGSYLYMLTSALFGVLLFLVRGPGWRAMAAGFWILALPYFLFSGTRSSFLAALMPGLLAFLFFNRQKAWIKLAVCLLAFMAIDTSLKLVVTFRNVGFRGLLVEEERDEMVDKMGGHQGLNMIQELCFENMALDSGGIQQDWGQRYLVEISNAIPRPLWRNKPRIGIEYAIWRGFEDLTGASDIGVVATVSTGFIGGGVMSFGPIFGPLVPALIMALWCGVLARWWLQSRSPLRACLFLAGLGVTANLGRDLTLLVAWPIVFGYLITLLIEKTGARPGYPTFVSPPAPVVPASYPAGSSSSR